MTTFYDDNYGKWEDMNDPEVVDYYRQVQATNITKKCSVCGRRVKIQPRYDKCNRCADMIERGLDAW